MSGVAPELRSSFVVLAVLILLIVPLVVISNVPNVAAQAPGGGGGGPGAPGGRERGVTIQVVELVQVVVVVEVKSQVTDVIPTALVVSAAAASPVTVPPSSPEAAFANMDAVGLVAGSIAMLGAAAYLTYEGIHRREGLTWLNPQPEPPSPEGLRKIPVSQSVYYQYMEQDGKRSLEGLVASGRWFPGVFVNKRFYYGMHLGDRFLPGIVSVERFIPGMMSKAGFFPGLATDEGFTPGIIATGVFVPGIVHGNNFVPGIVRDQRFIPGCFTIGREFVPGRFWNRRFETGLMEGSTFVPSECERLSPEAARALPEKGFGIRKVGAGGPIGGLPIRGVVVGEFDVPAFLPVGMISDQGIIVGGMMPGERYRSLDPSLEHPFTPTRDAASELLGALGINKYDIFGIGGWNSEEEGFEDRLKREMNDLSNLNQNQLGSKTWGTTMAEGMELLGGGDDALINSLNEEWNKQMQGMFGSSARGGTSGGGGTSQRDSWEKSPGQAVGDLYTAGMKGAGYGAAIGAAIGVVGAGFGGFIGFVVGALYEGIRVMFGGDSSGDDKSKEEKEKPGGGTKDGAEEEERRGGEGYTPTERGYNPAIMHFYDPGRKTLINWQQSEWGQGGPEDHSHGAVINFVQTDTGLITVVNYEALREALLLAGAHAGQTPLGLNVVTGEMRYVSAHPLSPEEQRKHALHDLLVKMYMNPVSPPLPDYEGKAPAAKSAAS